MEGIQSTLSTLASLTPVVLAAFFCFVIYRTQSIYVLLNRVWRVAAGGKPVDDQEIRRYADDIYSLTYFRFVSNLKVASLRQAKSAIRWSERKSVDLRDAARCGNYFDTERFEVRTDRIPSKMWRASIRTVLSLMLFISVSLVGVISVLDVAFLKFKEGGHSFLLTEEGAKRYGAYARLDAEMCSRSENPVFWADTGFDEKEAKILCEFVTDENFKRSFDDELSDQRKSSWMIALMLLGMVSPLFLWSFQISASLKLDAYLRNLERAEDAPEVQA